MKTLFLESIAGIAGDMFAASFLDAGLVTEEELKALPGRIGFDDVEIVVTRRAKATIAATHLEVRAHSDAWQQALGGHSHGPSHSHAHPHGPQPEEHPAHTHEHGHSHEHKHEHDHAHDHPHEHGHNHDHSHPHEPETRNPEPEAHHHTHTPYSAIKHWLGHLPLDEAIGTLASRIYAFLAEAEAAAHGMPVEDVTFHEVGAIDSVMDVLMAAYCIHKVQPDQVTATPVRLGRGHVHIAHGTHAVPPPASARLVVGMPVAEVPAAIERPNVELSTPTGLAILRALAPTFAESWPGGRVLAQGMGAGTMDLGAYPNLFRVVLLETGDQPALPYETDQVVEITCNVDDQPAERTAWVLESVMERGALDAWIAPVTGKKGRAAVCLSLLATPADWPRLADWLLRHSSTFGLRYRTWDRLKLAREETVRETAHGPVSFKVGRTTDGDVLKEKPEYEDLKRIWEEHPDFRP